MAYQPTFGNTTIPTELILKAWAKNTWDCGKQESYFSKFMGTSSDSIIQIQEDLSRGKGTSIEVSLLMPLNGAGVIEDKKMENHEEKMNYRSCTVYLSRVRNAVRLAGKFEEQKTQEKMRADMRKVLSNWIARYFDLSIFAVLTGTNPPFYTTGVELPYTIEAPTADRILISDAGGTAHTNENQITAADVFDTTLIGKARRMAQADELTAIKPIRIDGRETYVMVIDPYQARDLRRDPKWLEAQEYANIRGETNPIFSGAMGIYEGVVIHECLRVPRTQTGSGSGNNKAMVGHALFLGAQACILAEGTAPTWTEDKFDYQNQYGVCIDRFFGLKKAQFKYDGTNLTDFGVINVLTSSADD
ncbi:MAG: N4-gp56 family major capsid protein [Selenomonadaceae bacterium]|nr:N4-gp56 family major capsid protein [Selenomonadaceae bacterium]